MKANTQVTNTQIDIEFFSNNLNLENIPKNVSNWSETQNYAYLRFLSINAYKFESKKKKLKRRSLFSIMSDYIVTRSPQQCKSHHQKMIKFYGSIEGVIQRLRKTLHLDDPKQQAYEKSQTQKQTETQSSVQETPMQEQKCEEKSFENQFSQQNVWSFIAEQVWTRN